MKNRTNNRSRGGAWIISAGVVALISGAAVALEPGEGSDVLKGPQVTQTGAPDRGGDDTMGTAEKERGEKRGDREHAEPEKPRLGVILLTIRSLERGDASLKLTDEQKEAIKEIAQERREAMQAFMEAHKDEIHELRQQAGLPGRDARGEGRERGERRERRGREDRPTPENEMDAPPRDDTRRGPSDDSTTGNPRRGAPRDEVTPEQEAAREKLKALMATAPSDDEAIETVMGMLSPEQRQAVEERIDKRRDQARRGEGGEAPRGARGERGERGEPRQRLQRRQKDD